VSEPEDDPKTVLLCKMAGIISRRGTPTDDEVGAIRALHAKVLHNEAIESEATKRAVRARGTKRRVA
jgi:hypothetical protein